MKNSTGQYASCIPNYPMLNTLNYACLRFLKLATNIMIGLVFLQHINQTREDSVELARVSEVGINLSKQVDDLNYLTGQYAKELKSNQYDVFYMEEELEICVENLRRMEKEIDNLVLEKEKLENEVASLKKISAVNLFMPKLTPYFIAGITSSMEGGSIDTSKESIPSETLETLDRFSQNTTLQNIAKTKALKKFGEGPYLVMIEFEFPPKYATADPFDTNTNKIFVEMAPLELMPYTVNHFLEQVSQKLYDGSSIVRNPGHVLLASHIPYFANAGTDIYTPFVQAELDLLPFQEYSQDYAHEQYTLGFGGRPGGTEFYISMQNNTVPHGPGFHDRDADPCFAKVLRGFETLKRIQNVPTKEDGNVLVDFVGIKSIAILEDFDLDYNSRMEPPHVPNDDVSHPFMPEVFIPIELKEREGLNL